jgi:hypothetical protein
MMLLNILKLDVIQPIDRTNWFLACPRGSLELEMFRINTIIDTIWNHFGFALLFALYDGLLSLGRRIPLIHTASNGCTPDKVDCCMVSLPRHWTIMGTSQMYTTSSKLKSFRLSFLRGQIAMIWDCCADFSLARRGWAVLREPKIPYCQRLEKYFRDRRKRTFEIFSRYAWFVPESEDSGTDTTVDCEKIEEAWGKLKKFCLAGSSKQESWSWMAQIQLRSRLTRGELILKSRIS